MTVENSPENISCNVHGSAVKLLAGSSIVKIKPLFTYDSKYILVASGCNIKVFSIASGEHTLVFKGHKEAVVSQHINPRNNLQILSCSKDGIVIRWDYSDGKILKKYKLGQKNEVISFYAPSATGSWFVSARAKGKDFCKVYSITMKKSGSVDRVKIMSPVAVAENCVAFGPECSYVAGICGNSMLLYDMATKNSRRHKTGEVDLICVACHPKQYIVATGDVLGRIIVWTGMLETNYPTRSVHHWHSLPLPDLVFSPEGCHIYSAGGESVLVKWNLESGTKVTVPRLGLPICHLAVSPDNSYIAIAHIDNALQVVNSHNVVVQVIQGLTKGHCQKFGTDEVLPTGLHYDPRSTAVVLNGRVGHLQFYNILEDKQLFHLDIVGQSYVSQEREYAVIHTEVTRLAIDSKGLWLATVECRDDGETSPEIRLKFWQFDVISQKFVLNTTVFLPHSMKVNCVKFQPEMSAKDFTPMAVTTSDDKRFKLWTLNENRDSANWYCELVGCYKGMPAGDACFSEDGSLLCVAFNHAATLWVPDDVTLKTTLCHSQGEEHIRNVLFGRGECSHLLVCHTSSALIVWNILSLSVLWTVNCHVQYLVGDQFSDIMALFTAEKNLFIFRPSHPKPLSALKNVSKVPIAAAIFVPLKKMYDESMQSCCWQDKTKLFFLNQNQEMLTFGDINDENFAVESEKLILQQSQPVTPFGLMQAEHTTSGVKPVKGKHHILHGSNIEEKHEPMDLPCPTYVNPVSLCEFVLPSLLKVKIKSTVENVKNSSKSEHSETDSDEDNLEDNLNIEKQVETKEDSPKVKPVQSLKTDFTLLNDCSFLLDFVT